MLPAWRLAISSLSRRPSRSALLVGAVAMSAALVVAVACAMASVQGAINHQLAGTVGAADLRVRPVGTAGLAPAILERVRAWPEVAEAEPRLEMPLALSVKKTMMVRGEDGVWRRREMGMASTALGSSLRAREGGGEAGRPAHLPQTSHLSQPSERAYRALAKELAPDPEVLAGRLPERDDEVAIDAILAYRLSAEYQNAAHRRDGFIPGSSSYEPPRPVEAPEMASEAESARINAEERVAVGDTVEVVKQLIGAANQPLMIPGLSTIERLRVVGVVSPPPIGGRPQCYLTMAGLTKLTGAKGFTQIDIALGPGVDPAAAARARRQDLPASAMLETTDKITSGLDKNMKSSQLGVVLATVMAFMSAAFIITTGLTTGVTERQRELAILRCIGASRGQMGRMQLAVGLLLGLVGGGVGVPLGVAVAAGLAAAFRTQVSTGLVVPWQAVALGMTGAVLSGVFGAAWPAWRSATVSPLEGLAARAKPARARGIVIVTIAGLACLAYQSLGILLPRDGQVMFWVYVTSGLPLMFIGYFLLGVPATLGVVWIGAGVVSKVMRLPRHVLARTIAAKPYRHGFTAGALMGGLALLISIWTNGGATVRDWLDRIQFPDAFVSGLGLTEANQRQLDAMPEVAGTCAITLHPVEVDFFGVRALQQYKTTFVAFEPRAFLGMAALKWVQGDPETAVRRLEEGGAVIVAREFLIAQGLGVGQQFVCRDHGEEFRFEIVGVVASPGLEIVSKFFNVGEDYTDQAMHAVFGSRKDLKEKFFAGQEAPIHLIQIAFSPKVGPGGDEAALERVRGALLGSGVLDVGSGRQIKEQIELFAHGTILVLSAIALAAMLVACFGVANLIAASIEARRFEFGVLRAVGGQRGLLARLVLSEALIVGVTAAAMGTLMGLQGSWAGQRLHALLLGMELRLRPPVGAIAVAWGITLLMTVGAAGPAVWWLNRRGVRELLGGRG